MMKTWLSGMSPADADAASAVNAPFPDGDAAAAPPVVVCAEPPFPLLPPHPAAATATARSAARAPVTRIVLTLARCPRPPDRRLNAVRASRTSVRRRDRRQWVAEVREAMRQVDVRPVGDVSGNRLEDDLAVVASAEFGHDVVEGVGTRGDAPLDL